ncbi:MAG: hypothetical protein IPL79_14010 [Myxococcales bacterium]|nr:hypothetical protein [Myxococcales bacterium]
MALPTASELNPFPDDLDGQVAQRNFLGKTVEEAAQLFAKQGGSVEDLMWMGPRAFVYYLPAALRYLEGATTDCDEWDVVGALPGTIAFRLDHEAAEIADAWSTIDHLCAYVLAHADRLLDEWDRAEVSARYRDVSARISALRAGS